MSARDLDTIQSMDRPSLVQLWSKMIGHPPPPRLSHGMMVRILASEHQWQISGQKRSQHIKRLERVLAASTASKPIAQSGQRLVREWNGHQHIVDITPTGYLWNDKTWRSLSAIAKEITGTKWSGPRFFGVTS